MKFRYILIIILLTLGHIYFTTSSEPTIKLCELYSENFNVHTHSYDPAKGYWQVRLNGTWYPLEDIKTDCLKTNTTPRYFIEND